MAQWGRTRHPRNTVARAPHPSKQATNGRPAGGAAARGGMDAGQSALAAWIEAAERHHRASGAAGQGRPAKRAEGGGPGMAFGGKGRGEDHEVRAQAPGAGQAGASVGGDREEGTPRAAAGKKKGKKVFGGAPVRQVQAGAEGDRRAALAGNQQAEAAGAGQGGQGAQQARRGVAQEDGAAGWQAAGGGAGVGQAARVAQKPERWDGAGSPAVSGGAVLP